MSGARVLLPLVWGFGTSAKCSIQRGNLSFHQSANVFVEQWLKQQFAGLRPDRLKRIGCPLQQPIGPIIPVLAILELLGIANRFDARPATNLTVMFDESICNLASLFKLVAGHFWMLVVRRHFVGPVA